MEAKQMHRGMVEDYENSSKENGIIYKEITTIDNFMKLLDKKIDEAKDMLLERFNYICSQDPSSAKFMWENNTMFGYNEKEGIFGAMKHGTLALG